ncbi:OsmC family protein [Lentibacillus sp. L22]|uniref:OsmC family protein n=1 Tax=Lentibacillus TaxID=175304 RepID=UPI0022B0AB43|nr:OsmC family protein [Lentibacillus daqui]
MDFYLKDNGMRSEFEFGTLSVSGDEQYGFRPFQLMVASIAGCSASVFRKILDKQRTDYEDLIVHADVERNPDVANRIERVALTFTIKGHRLNADKLERNLELSRKNCSMIRSVEDSIAIEEKLHVIELSK